METVLGVSITATEVRAALVEGANADGVLIEQDVFDIAACDGSATPNTADQVTAVVLGTQQGALAATVGAKVQRCEAGHACRLDGYAFRVVGKHTG